MSDQLGDADTVLVHDEARAEALGLDWWRLPFAFSPSFSRVLARHHKGDYLLFELRTGPDASVYVPALVRRKAWLTVLRFLHVPVRAEGAPLTLQDEERTIARLVQFLQVRKMADRIAAPFNWCIFQSVPARSVHSRFGTYILDLEKDPAQLWAGLHSKHRNVVRNAQAHGTVIRHGPEQLHAFYRLYLSTMARSAIAAEPLEHFEALLADNASVVFCAVVYHLEVPQGAVLIPFSAAGAFYVYGGSADKVTPTGAINLLHYQAMLILKERGASKYDFVGARLSDVSGTKLAGIQKFKERFGGRLVEGHLWKLDLSPFRCAIFDAMLKARSLLLRRPLGLDIIDQERLKNQPAGP